MDSTESSCCVDASCLSITTGPCSGITVTTRFTYSLLLPWSAPARASHTRNSSTVSLTGKTGAKWDTSNRLRSRASCCRRFAEPMRLIFVSLSLSFAFGRVMRGPDRNHVRDTREVSCKKNVMMDSITTSLQLEVLLCLSAQPTELCAMEKMKQERNTRGNFQKETDGFCSTALRLNATENIYL